MQSIELDPTHVRIAGVQEVDRSGPAVVLQRLPAWARAQVVDPAVHLLTQMPCGARLELDTDATVIELEVGLTLVQLGDDPVVPAAFDLTVAGQVVARPTSIDGTVISIDRTDGSIDFRPGPSSTTVQFEGLPADTKRVEIWLPHAAAVTLHELRVDDGAAVAAPAPDPRRRWAHYGSSISHCLEATSPTGVWPVVAARQADVALDSFAIAGQCQLDPFVARTLRDLPLDLISLKLGINLVNGDTMRERAFVPAVHGFLDTIRDGHPSIPLLVVTPILCPAHEQHPGPTVGGTPISVIDRRPALAVGSLTVGRIRELLAEVVAARRAAGDEHLHLLDGRELFGENDLDDLPDGLHPNAAGYQRMGERFHAVAFGPGGPFA